MADNEETNKLNTLITGDATGFIAALDKMQTALNSLVTKLQESGSLSKTVADQVNKNFEQLGKGAKDFASTMTGMQSSVRGVVDSIKSIESASTGFMNSNVNMSRQVASSSATFDNWTKSAGENVTQIGKLNPQLRELITNGNISKDVYEKLATQLNKNSSSSVEYKKSLIDMAQASGNNVQQFEKSVTALNQVEKAIGLTKIQLKETFGSELTKNNLTTWGRNVDRVAAAYDFLDGRIHESNGVMLDSSKTWTRLNETFGTTANTYEKLATSGGVFQKQFEDLTAKAKTGGMSFVDYQKELLNLNNKFNTVTGGMDKWNEATSKMNTALQFHKEALANTTQYAKGLEESVSKGTITYGEAAKKLTDFVGATKSVSDQVEKLTNKNKEMIASQSEFSTKATGVVDAFKNQEISYNNAQTQLAGLSKEWGNSVKEMEKFFSTSQKATETVSANAIQSERLSRVQKVLTQDLKEGNIGYVEATNVLNQHMNTLKNTGNSMGSFGQFVDGLRSKLTGMTSAGQVATTWLGNLGHAIGSMSVWIPAAMIISTLTEAITGSITAVKDFDQALKTLQAISGATDAEISLLGDRMLEISDTTKYSASEIAKGAVYIAQAGFTAEEAIKVISAAAIGAQGTLEPLTTAADLLTTVIRAFHKEAKDASSIMDILAIAANDSKTNLEGMRTMFNYIGPAAYSAGLSINETAGALMTLSNMGIKTSTVGTSLRMVLVTIEKGTGAFGKAVREAHMDMSDFDFKTKGLVGVLESLNKLIGGDVSKAFTIFSQRAGNTVLILSEMHEYVNLLIKDTNQFGIAQMMADKQTEGLTVKLALLSNTFRNMLIRFSEGGTTNIFKDLTDATTGLIKALDFGLNSSLGKTITFLGLVIVGGEIFLTLLVKLASFTGLSKMLTAINTAIAAQIAIEEGAIVATGGLSGALVTLTAAFNALWLAILKHPMLAFLMVVGSIIVYMYNWKKANDEVSTAMQKQVITYANLRDSAKDLSKNLKDLSDSQETDGQKSQDYFAIMSKIKELYPELQKEMAKTQGDYKKQSELLDAAQLHYKKETESLVAEITEINNQKFAYENSWVSQERFLVGSKLIALGNSENERGFHLLGSALEKLGNWYLNASGKIDKNISSMSAQMNVQHSMIVSAQEEARAIGLLDEKEQGLYLSRLKGSQEYNDLVNKLVATSNKMKQAMTANDASILASAESSLTALGKEWSDYYKKQTDTEKVFVAEQMTLALKAGETAAKAMEKTLTDSDLSQQAKQSEIAKARETAEKEFFVKMTDIRAKYVDDILKLLDKETDQDIKALQKGTKAKADLLETEKEMQISSLRVNQLNEEKFLISKKNLEETYNKESLKNIKSEADKEIEIINNNFEKKKKVIESTNAYISEEVKKRPLVEAEKVQADQLIVVYESELAAMKKSFGERLREADKYTNEIIRLEKEIATAKENYAKKSNTNR